MRQLRKAASRVTSEQREVLLHRVQVQTASDVQVAEATAVEAKPPWNMLMVFRFAEGVFEIVSLTGVSLFADV